MIFGTFDGLHLGHLNFFKQARNLSENTFLIVSVARDKNVIKIKNKAPRLSEIERLNLIKKCKSVNKAILASKNGYLSYILKENPDIIAFGYDQRAYVKELKKDIKEKDLKIKIVRLKPYKANIYKNHILNKV